MSVKDYQEKARRQVEEVFIPCTLLTRDHLEAAAIRVA
jgi:hypothetical protein